MPASEQKNTLQSLRGEGCYENLVNILTVCLPFVGKFSLDGVVTANAQLALKTNSYSVWESQRYRGSRL